MAEPLGQPTPRAAPPGLLATVGWVALGGALGSLARAGVSQAIGEPGEWPLGTLCVNLLGAFLLGLLLETLATRPHERLRLLLGTGVLGGFTTYSLLASQLAEQILTGQLWVAAGYAVATLCGGLLASAAGVLIVQRARTPRRREVR